MKKKVILIIGLIIGIVIITIVSLYIANEDVRNWMDEYIFRKNIEEEDLPTIQLENENSNILVF